MGPHLRLGGGGCCFTSHELRSYLEDHPMTCKWLITMVIISPLSRVGLVINGLNGHINGGY